MYTFLLVHCLFQEIYLQFSKEMKSWITTCITKQCMVQGKMCLNFGPQLMILPLVRVIEWKYDILNVVQI